MRRPNGNLGRADDLLRRAQQLAPYDRTVRHSMAELALERAEKSMSDVECETRSREARRLALSDVGPRTRTAYGYHTLAKIGLERLIRLLHQPPEEIAEAEVDQRIKEAAGPIEEGLQRFPDE